MHHTLTINIYTDADRVSTNNWGWAAWAPNEVAPLKSVSDSVNYTEETAIITKYFLHVVR